MSESVPWSSLYEAFATQNSRAYQPFKLILLVLIHSFFPIYLSIFTQFSTLIHGLMEEEERQKSQLTFFTRHFLDIQVGTGWVTCQVISNLGMLDL